LLTVNNRFRRDFGCDTNTNRLTYMQLSNYNSFEGVLYCRPHFDQLFKRTGSLDKSFEGKKGYQESNNLIT